MDASPPAAVTVTVITVSPPLTRSTWCPSSSVSASSGVMATVEVLSAGVAATVTVWTSPATLRA